MRSRLSDLRTDSESCGAILCAAHADLPAYLREGKTMMKKILRLLPAVLVILLVAVGCGSSSKIYKDGTYTGKSSVYENDDGTTDGNGYGQVQLTISGGKITACEYDTYEVDGTLKDEDYGKENGEVKNRDYYNKAQKALAAASKYAEQLVDYGGTSDIKDHIDAISGATINYNHFLEAVDDALSQAEAS